MTIIKCCKDCQRRTENCHSTCKQYAAEKAAWAKTMQQYKQEHLIDRVESQRIQLIEKSVRKLMKQRRGY